MEAKLTLKLDKMAIDTAKRYAQRHTRSHSGMVENYVKKHTPVVKSLTGVLTESELEKFAEEDERIRYIVRKET